MRQFSLHKIACREFLLGMLTSNRMSYKRDTY